MPIANAFGARAALGPGLPDLYRLSALPASGLALGVDLGRSPVTLKILLENALRHAGGGIVREEDVAALAAWRPGGAGEAEIPFMPGRVVLQDFTGVPAVVDLAAMRDAMADLGGDPARVNPLVPADLVIDHSVQVDAWGGAGAFAINVEREYERNGERYQLLRWAQTAFRDLRVVPPGTGIIHQVNLEYLATVVADREDEGGRVAYPDTLVGTDSHTTMINGLGVLGYGVGGIEAEAVLLGQPLYQPMPRIVGVRPDGRAADGVDRDRPRAGHHRAAARVRRRGRLRRVRGRRPRRPVARRPGDDLEHEPRVRRDRDAVPDRRRDPVVPAAHGPDAGPGRPRRALRQGPGPVARARQRAGVRRRARARPRHGRAVARRSPPAAGPGAPGGPRRQLPGRLPADRRRPRALDPGRGRRAAVRPRLGGDRGHHVVHQHVQPDRDGRRRAARPQRRRPRAARLAHRQDLARAGIQGRDRLPREGRPDAAARGARLLAGGVRLHDVHRQLRPPRRADRAGHRIRRARGRGGPVGQPQLRGPDPPAGAGRRTSRRRRWSSRSRWPAGSTST